jgi:hypothetical protein
MFENIAEIGGSAFRGDGFIDFVESCDDARHPEIAILFTTIARIVGKGKIAGIVRPAQTGGDDVVYINGVFVKLEINRLATDKTIALLPSVKFLKEGRPIFCGEAVQVEG